MEKYRTLLSTAINRLCRELAFESQGSGDYVTGSITGIMDMAALCYGLSNCALISCTLLYPRFP